MYNRFNSKYDEYGRLKTEPWPEIKKGDMVSFITIIRFNRKPKKFRLFGYWDGEKVKFEDKNNYIVRTTRWLTKENE